MDMIKITDKSFHYTPSFNTDLKKKFRRMAQELRSAEARGKAAGAAMGHSVVTMVARRSVAPKA